jgi:two-component system cell cycle response regulator
MPADAEHLGAALARIGAAGSVTVDLRHRGPAGGVATVQYTFFLSPQAPDAVLAVGRPRDGSATLDDRLTSMQARLAQMHGRVERLRDQLAEEVAGDEWRSLPTRWEFEQILEREWARAARLGLVLSLLAIDVDGLRHVNSRFGQREGDRVLREVAARLLRQTRSYDALARADGGGFLLVTVRLPADERSAAAFARRVQRLVSGEPIDLGEGQQTRVTVSVGVASAALSSETPLAPEALQNAAREALREAKAAGGNEVRLTAALPTGD